MVKNHKILSLVVCNYWTAQIILLKNEPLERKKKVYSLFFLSEQNIALQGDPKKVKDWWMKKERNTYLLPEKLELTSQNK